MQDNHNPQGLMMFLLMLVGNILFFIYISFIHEGIPNSGISQTVPKAQLEKK
jgi:hypothetical protein